MKSALITGCSTGIGRATALALVESGFVTYATARKPESLDALAEAGCRILRLDVTDDESCMKAVHRVEDDCGSVGVLINNAGYGEYGPVEELDLDDVRREFETNVFGLIRLCQLVLPAMRRNRSGRIINVSSMGGEMVLPMGAAYHATKYAVEAFSDSLRLEVKPFGIKVTVVQPGPIPTNFAETVSHSKAMQPTGGPYDEFKKRVGDSFAEFYRRPVGGATAGQVANVILNAALVAKPPTRVKVSLIANALPRLRRLTPDAVWDAGVNRQFGGKTKPARKR